jgi:hypothetical protein
MNELLEKMLSSDLLTEETRKELVDAFNAELERATAEATTLAIAEAKVDFAKQFAEDKEALVEAIDTKVTALLTDEIQELKEDIERFRDLEAEFATRLVEEKEKMGLQLKADVAQLVETLDVFLEQRLTEELDELKESIEEVKKIEFAKNLFESIEDTFRKKFFDESGLAKKLDESAAELAVKAKALSEVEARLSKLVREKEMSRVLDPLHGRPREIMEAILKSVKTDQLDEAYTNFIGRVLHESATTVAETKTEKENAPASVLAESASTAETLDTTIVVSGDSTVNEHVEEPRQSFVSDAEKARLRKIAGINR